MITAWVGQSSWTRQLLAKQLVLSGTKVRDMLAAGQELPEEFARPEVAHILMDFYQNESRG